MEKLKKSLLMVHTGEGKGKTTAALGIVFRMMGHGKRVCVIQFIKGGWTSGEAITAKQFPDLLDFRVMGRGFTFKSEDREKDAAAAVKAWETARRVIESGKYRLVILDELTYLIHYKMVPEAEILAALKARPENVHVLVTGRYASSGLIAAADMVTEMKLVKHHFKAGVAAQKGIEF